MHEQFDIESVRLGLEQEFTRALGYFENGSALTDEDYAQARKEWFWSSEPLPRERRLTYTLSKRTEGKNACNLLRSSASLVYTMSPPWSAANAITIASIVSRPPPMDASALPAA
jgi:hypothetical protein